MPKQETKERKLEQLASLQVFVSNYYKFLFIIDEKLLIFGQIVRFFDFDVDLRE